MSVLEWVGVGIFGAAFYASVASYVMGWWHDTEPEEPGMGVFFGVIWPVSLSIGAAVKFFKLVGQYPYNLAVTRKTRHEIRAAAREGREAKLHKIVLEPIPQHEWTSAQIRDYYDNNKKPTRRVKVDL